MDYLYYRAEKLGVDAFPHFGRAHYYSGPNKAVLAELEKSYGKAFSRNHARAIDWAKKHHATIIDNTPLALFLAKFDSFGRYSAPEDQLLPWRHLSRMYALSMWGSLSTTVCGADTVEGVYCNEEITHTINPHHSELIAPGSFDADFYHALFNPTNKKIADINISPFHKFETLYNPHDILPVHHRVCLTEQRMGLYEAIEGADEKTIRASMKLAAQDVCSRPVEAFEYFLDSRERFLLDRKNVMKVTAQTNAPFYKRSPSERAQHKDDKLKQFGLMVWKLVETELSLMPASSRPKIILPPCLIGSVLMP
ncbi:MAG: hypothetical protein EOM37_01275 [Proteobacteria bacterium]|nr:hypothetical protein [Pseudomonadota bacterium]